MPRSNGDKSSRHPLILRLQAIARGHRRSARQDRANMKLTPRHHAAIRGFYFAAAAQHIQAAVLIEEAIAKFPISLHANALKGGKR